MAWEAAGAGSKRAERRAGDPNGPSVQLWFGMRVVKWAGGPQVSACVTSHEPQPQAASLSPKICLQSSGETFKSDPTPGIRSCPYLSPFVGRKGSLGSTPDLLVLGDTGVQPLLPGFQTDLG